MKILLFLFHTLLTAATIQDIPRPPPAEKHLLAVAAIFQNEGSYLQEWIEYHRLIGVDHFYLYNNNSWDRFRKILAPYVKAGLVTLIPWPDRLTDSNRFAWPLSTQIPAYENAIKRALKHAEWLLFLNIDEFLVGSQDSLSVLEILKKTTAPAVALDTICFNSSSRGDVPQRKLVIQTVEVTQEPPKNPQKDIVKLIFKPDECAGFSWPPYSCNLKKENKPEKIGRETLRIHRYIERGQLSFEKKPKTIVLQKSKGTPASLAEEGLLLEMGCEVENRSLEPFIPKILQKLGFE
jgi:hypothetical protein